MKNDHDFSKHVKVPDEWMEKALAVPYTQPSLRVKLFSARRLTAAAIILLVFGVSIGLYFYIRNIKAMPAAPSATESILSPTVSQSGTVGSDTPLSLTHPGTGPTVPASVPTQSAAAPTQAQPTEPSTAAPAVSPTQAHTQPSPIVQPTTGEPSGRPNEKPATSPVAPTSVPQISSGEDPTDGQDIEPDPEDSEKHIEISHTPAGNLPVSPANEGGDPKVIYCRLYDGSGKLVGEPDLYCAAHLAEWVFTDSGSYFYYEASIPDPDAAGIAYTSDARTYTYEFYNKRGQVLGTGTFRV